MPSGDHQRILCVVSPWGERLTWTAAKTQPGCWRRFADSTRPNDVSLFRRLALDAGYSVQRVRP